MILDKKMKSGGKDRSDEDLTSPDENRNPSKRWFPKIFKKKSVNSSFNTVPENVDEEVHIPVRRSHTLSEIPRPTSVFGQVDHRCKSFQTLFYVITECYLDLNLNSPFTGRYFFHNSPCDVLGRGLLLCHWGFFLVSDYS